MISAGISAVGGIASGIGSFFGGKAQADAQKQALAMEQQMFNTGVSAEQPYLSYGQNLIPTLTKLLTPGADQTSVLSQLPGFQFASDWATKAMTNSMTGRGLGGNVLKGVGDVSSGLAQQFFGNLVSMLQGGVNTGASAANAIMSGANSMAGTMAGTLTNLGNANAASIMGPLNSVGGLANNFGMFNAISNLFKGGGGMYSPASWGGYNMTGLPSGMMS